MDPRHTLEDYLNDLKRCCHCSMCKFIPLIQIKNSRYSQVCPAISQKHFHAFCAGGKMHAALALLEGRIEANQDLLDVVYQCSTCGGCDVSCKHNRDLEPLEALFALRAHLVREGVGPLPEHEPILKSMRNYDNVWQQPRHMKGRWAKDISVKDPRVKDLTKESAKVLYFAGCTFSLQPDLMRVPLDTLGILLEAGVDVGILGSDEPCCASPAFTIGDHDFFMEKAAANIRMFNDLGIKKVVTSCAGCFGVMSGKYPAVEKMDFEVMHAVSYIEELIREGRIKLTEPVRMKVTYHDPCHLGRQSEPYIPWDGKEEKVLNSVVIHEPPKKYRRGTLGVYEAPRAVMRAIPGLELAEMHRIREYAFCCGSGGGVKTAFPTFALNAAKERVSEALETGAEALVTACPWCEANLGEALAEGNGGMRLLDFIDLVKTAMGGGSHE